MSHSAELYLLRFFLPYSVKEWNKLDPEIRDAEAYAFYQKMLLNFITLRENRAYKIYDRLGIKLLTRLQLGFIHLSKHKFRHKLPDSLNPSCSCSLETDSTIHHFLTLPKLYCFTQSPYESIKKCQ